MVLLIYQILESQTLIWGIYTRFTAKLTQLVWSELSLFILFTAWSIIKRSVETHSPPRWYKYINIYLFPLLTNSHLENTFCFLLQVFCSSAASVRKLKWRFGTVQLYTLLLTGSNFLFLTCCWLNPVCYVTEQNVDPFVQFDSAMRVNYSENESI